MFTLELARARVDDLQREARHDSAAHAAHHARGHRASALRRLVSRHRAR